MTRPNTQPRGGQQALADERPLADVMQAVHEKSERVRLAMLDLQMETETLTRKLVEAQANLFGSANPPPVARYVPPLTESGQREANFRRGDADVQEFAAKLAAPTSPGTRQSPARPA